MNVNIKKADATMRKLNAIDGVYCKPVKSLCSNIKHMAKANTYRITVDVDEDQLGGNKCVSSVLECKDSLKMIPVLVFIDPSEVKENNK